MMKILIYGAGAVGGFIGSRLFQQKHDVTLVSRKVTGALIKQHGLLVTEEGRTRKLDLQVLPTIAAAFMDEPRYDLIILGMKAYDVEATLDPLVAFCPQPPPIIALQNGIGVEELLAAQFGAEQIIAGSVTIPIRKESANHLLVEKTDRGIALAPVASGQSIKSWAALFKDAGLKTAVMRDYRSLKWSKAFLNIIGNATAAILNRKPRLIYQSDSVFELEFGMLQEMLAVMRAAKIKVVDLPGASASRLAFGMRRLPKSLFRPMLTRLVTDGRGDKMPSFYIDLNSGKGQSEVLFHNGAVARKGAELGVPAPINAALTDILWRLTIEDLDWRAFDGRPRRLLQAVKNHRDANEQGSN